jgi:hypothetical protein
MMVPFDNATPYAAKCTIDYLKGNRLMQAPDPAFSPALAPWDCYLFGKLNMALMDATFVDDDELLQGVNKMLNGTSREELEEVFKEWLLRLDRCIQQDREYRE